MRTSSYSIRRKGKLHYVTIKPFYIIGIGKTKEAAIKEAEELLISHLEGLIEALKKYGLKNVQLF